MQKIIIILLYLLIIKTVEYSYYQNNKLKFKLSKKIKIM